MPARQIKYLSQLASRPHNVFYKEWGNEDNSNVLLCVHGLSRNSGDFDVLSSKLEDAYRVVCPDMPGRGQSDWLPQADYQFPLYVAEVMAIIARLGVQKVDWLGTSMGAVIGMLLASQPNTPIRKLVLNDAGPFASRQMQINIAANLGNDERFKTFDEVTEYFKNIYASWGKITQEQWVNVAQQSSRKLEDGTYALAYDPGIVASLKGNLDAVQDVSLWPLFEAIQIPILVLHGTESTVLPTEIAEEMKRRNKNVELVDFPGIGHAPSLMEDHQIKLIRNWLLK
jgi:pimeloyl-ACP methyl ester carboxylesterase